LTKDYTDDIYDRSDIKAEHFVDYFNSTMFVNLLIVVPKMKQPTFKAELEGLMNEYYEAAMALEVKKTVD